MPQTVSFGLSHLPHVQRFCASCVCVCVCVLRACFCCFNRFIDYFPPHPTLLPTQIPTSDNPAFTIARTRPDYKEEDCTLYGDDLDFDIDEGGGGSGGAGGIGGTADIDGNDGDDDGEYVFL